VRISHQYQLIFLALARAGSTTARNTWDQYSDIKSVHVSEVNE
jgi:hypothetical protein